jgi:hypothetical protein
MLRTDDARNIGGGELSLSMGGCVGFVHWTAQTLPVMPKVLAQGN